MARVKALIDKGKDLSPVLKSSLEVLLFLVMLLAHQLGLKLPLLGRDQDGLPD